MLNVLVCDQSCVGNVRSALYVIFLQELVRELCLFVHAVNSPIKSVNAYVLLLFLKITGNTHAFTCPPPPFYRRDLTLTSSNNSVYRPLLQPFHPLHLSHHYILLDASYGTSILTAWTVSLLPIC